MKFALISLRLISSMTFLQFFCWCLLLLLLLRLLRRCRFQILCIIWCLIPCQPIGAYSLSFHLPINKICILGGLMACCVHQAVCGFCAHCFLAKFLHYFSTVRELVPQFSYICIGLHGSFHIKSAACSTLVCRIRNLLWVGLWEWPRVYPWNLNMLIICFRKLFV